MIQCIVIDDDAHDLAQLQEHVERIPFLKLAGSFSNAFHAIEYLSSAKVDLIITDVEMPTLGGFEMMHSIRHAPPCIIISGQAHHAAEAFNIEAIDFMVKPFTFERFLKAINRVREQIQIKTTPAPAEISATKRNFFFIKSDYKTYRINFSEILFIEGFKDYIKLHMHDRAILSLLSLNMLERWLPAELFTRVHRSYIVALGKIDVIEKNRIRIGVHTITISETYRETLIKRLQVLK